MTKKKQKIIFNILYLSCIFLGLELTKYFIANVAWAYATGFSMGGFLMLVFSYINKEIDEDNKLE